MQSRTAGMAVLLVGILVGTLAAMYGTAFADRPILMVAPSLCIVLLTLLVMDRRKLLVFIMIFRSAGDMVFETAKFSIGSYQMGVGGLVNLFVILIVALLIVEKPGVLSKKMVTIWVGFLLVTLFGAVVAPVSSEAIRIYLALVSYFAIFLSTFYLVRSQEDFRQCLRVVFWSSLLPTAYAFVELAMGGVIRHDGVRLQSTFTHPNIFAFYLTLVISVVLYLLKTPTAPLSGPKRVMLTGYMGILLGLLLLTQTRSAWIACFLLFAVYGLMFERRYLLYLLCLPFVALLIPTVRDRILELGTGNEVVQYAKLNSFAWRVLIWESGLNWMRPANYLLGYGLDSFRYYSPVFFPMAGENSFGAHNVYVQLLFEVGAVGLSIYLWMYARVLRVLRHLTQVDKLGALVVIAMVLEYLFVSTSDNMLWYLAFNWYFWFVVGAAMALVVAMSPAVAGRAAGASSLIQGSGAPDKGLILSGSSGRQSAFRL